MKLKLHSLIISSLTFSLLVLFPKHTFASTVTLTGHVQSSSGASITGATVSVNDAKSDQTTTDGSGNYTLSVPSGTYNVQVTPLGGNFSSAVALNQNISSNTVLNFILDNTGTVTLSGHLLDAAGHPLANQNIILQSSTSTLSTTDNNGNYSLQVSPGSYALIILPQSPNDLGIQIPYYYKINASINLDQTTILDLTLPAKQVNVHVQNTAGNSVVGAAITVPNSGFLNSNFSLGNGINASSVQDYYSSGPSTDNSGNATLWLFPSGSDSYTITATPSSGTASSTSLSVSDNTATTITVQQPVTFSGHLYDAAGHALANQNIVLQGSTSTLVTTDSTGSYSFLSVPGSYTLTLLPQSPNDLSMQVPYFYKIIANITLTQDTQLDLTLPAKLVSVHVQDTAGNAVAGAALQVVNSGVWSTNFSLGTGVTATSVQDYYSSGPSTDKSGNATLWLFPSGSNQYTLKATTTDGVTTTSSLSVVDNTSTTIVVPVQNITLSGHLYDAAGHSLANQNIILRSSSDTLATTDSTGNYSLSVSPGQYTLLLLPQSPNDQSMQIPQVYSIKASITLNQSTTVDLTIPAKKVSVHVQDSTGHALGGVVLNVTNPGFWDTSFSLGNGVNTYSIQNYYSSGPATDNYGNATLWLLPSGANAYTIQAIPTNSGAYASSTLNNVVVSGDQTEIVSLQYNHATPTTTAALSPSFSDGTYVDPTTVTLSADAASGYTVANIYYTVDGGAQQTYTAPFSVTGEGNHTITYWSVDNSGVEETHNTKTFTITEAYKLTGTVYNDNNQNGIQDSGETGYSGAIVALNTGQSTTTDSNGNYSFSNVETGSYVATLTVPNGYTTTTTNPVNVALAANTTQNFGITHTAPATTVTLSPSPYADGTYKDPTTVTLSATDQTGFTVANTYYTVDGGAQHAYSSPFTVTGSGSHTITYWSVDNVGLAEASHTKTFTITEAYNLSGSVYVDTNKNGVQDTGEQGFASATVTLSNGQTVTSNSNGNYTFNGVEARNYTESVTLPTGFSATTTNPATVALAANTTENFGIVPQAPTVSAISVTPNPVQINTSVSTAASFTDPVSSPTDTASWNWGDGSTPTSGTVTQPSGATPGSVTGSHTYTAAGVYTVTLTVTDNYGLSSTSTYNYISVYDANSSFAGGRSFTNPATASLNTTGKVTFGVSAKFSNTGALTGNAKMNFKNANIDFATTSLTSLVTNNGKGYLYGTGTVNGSGTYDLLVTGIDGSVVGGSDLIRYKITNHATGAVVYDSQSGASDTTNPTTAVDAGNVRIQ